MLPTDEMVDGAWATLHNALPSGVSPTLVRSALADAFDSLDRDALIEEAIEATPSHGPGGFGKYSPSHRRDIAEAVLRAVGLIA